MTRDEAHYIAQGIRDHLPVEMRQRLKAIDVLPKLHSGMCTVRIYCISKTAEEPESFIFPSEEI